MAGVDYRSLEAPAQVDTALPDNGARARAEALRGAFQEFEGLSSDVHNQLATQAGAIAGAAAGNTGHPQYKQGLAQLTTFGRAFNHAATGAYAIQAAAQADATAARLRVEANNDPEHFRTTYTAARDGALKAVPPIAQEAIRRLWDDRLNEGLAQISGDEARERQITQRKIYDVGIENQITRVAGLLGSPDPIQQLKGADQQVILHQLIAGGKNSGLYSEAEEQAMHHNAMREITEQVFTTNVDRALANMERNGGDAKDVTKLLDDFRQMHLDNIANTNEQPVLNEAEFGKLFSEAKQRLQQARMEDMYRRAGEREAKQERQDVGDRQLTVAMANHMPAHQLEQLVAKLVGSKDASDSVGRAVLGSIARTADGPVDPRAKYVAENNPARFDWDAAEILRQVGGNYKAAQELANKNEQARQGWENHAAIRDAHKFIDDKLKLPTGLTLDMASDAQKKAYADAHVEFTSRMNQIPLGQRDAEAGRISNNVVLELQARTAERNAEGFARNRDYIEQDSGPHGDHPNPAVYKHAIDEMNARIAAARKQADDLRKGIK